MALTRRRSTRISARSRKRAPQNWYSHTGLEAWRERLARTQGTADVQERGIYLAGKRAARLRTLNDNVKQLRRFFTGFDAADGYNLLDIPSWHVNRVHSVEQYSEYLNHLLSQPHSRVVAHTKAEFRGLRSFTGQRLRRQYAFVVHTPTDRDEVAVGKKGEVIIVRELPTGGFLQSEFYFFEPIIDWQPVTWDELVDATDEIIDYMPDGNYFIYSELHGEIDTPHRRDILPRLIRRYELEYNTPKKQFADTILGFKRVADDITPNEEYARIYERRQTRKEQKARQWNRLRKQIQREAKMKVVAIKPKARFMQAKRVKPVARKKKQRKKVVVRKKKKTRKTVKRHK